MTQPDEYEAWRGQLAASTPEQIMAGIAAAIQARDWDAVLGLLEILAVKDPRQAQLVYDVIIFAAAQDAADQAGGGDP